MIICREDNKLRFSKGSDIVNIREYFSKVNKYIDNLSDEEFHALLIKSGLEKCPYVKDFTNEEQEKHNKMIVEQLQDINEDTDLWS
jgi:ATP-dependent protease HslVU (ClpYQ) ATPase subunit